MRDSGAFNPLDIEHLGESVAGAMLRGPVVPITELVEFTGAGIYAIYYTGDHPAYALLAKANRDAKFAVPIYSGKAIPEGGRKGKVVVGRVSKALWKRLKEHAESVDKAANLDVNDFSVRWLVVEPIWIPLGESLLIGRLAPVWNQLIDGFGNHDPGAGRRQGVVPRWDVLHPGRAWAALLPARKETAEAIAQDVEEYLRARLDPDGGNPSRSL